MPLRQLYPDSGTPAVGNAAKIDIIAVHGLNPRSKKDADHAWDTWRTPQGPSGRLWLHEDLPQYVPDSRIFLYEYNATAVYGKDRDTFIGKANELLEAIRIERDDAGSRPILFLGHSMGGLLIKQALINAHNNPKYMPIKEATSGLAFFATPHRGGDWKLVSLGSLAVKIATRTGFQKGDDVLETLKEGSIFSDIMQEHWRHQLLKYDIISFWGALDSVVPRESARLGLPGDCENVVKLNADHETVCKFGPGQADQDNLKLVRSNIKDVYRNALQKMPLPEESLLDQADAYIHQEFYTEESLKIERLSGDRLPMEQCYINLVIVQKTGRSSGAADETVQHASQFSLLARLKVEKPTDDLQIRLCDIFNPRKAQDGKRTQPRRILVRGRAGVGKTTLCKKAVYEFINHRTWNDQFKRVLWVPLRRLRLRTGRYNLMELFCDEFFSQHDEGTKLAAALRAACETPDGGRTLFILDGLDELWHELSYNSDMSRFVKHLLNQPNVIVMSRPSVTPPADLKPFDLELETIGFDSDQVATYVEKVEPGSADVIGSFLDSHPLVRDLARIPIQLDALCYAWNDVYQDQNEPETMTDLYKAIERGLWRKDILRLEKKVDDRPVNENDILHAVEVEDLIQNEAILLEGLAFTGLYNDVIVFDAVFRNAVSAHFTQPGKTMDRTLRKLSYLRTSDPLAKEQNRTYHFLHLTLQEYFAARYFVRMWKHGDKMTCLQLDRTKRLEVERKHRQFEHTEVGPRDFLLRYKYSARYDIVWRFVVGLLSSEAADAGEEMLLFFNAIDMKPFDLLGPTHQRLTMHCLSEVSLSHKSPEVISLRDKLEKRLSRWLIFQCKMAPNKHVSSGANYDSKLPTTMAAEMEFPEQALINVLQRNENELSAVVLESLARRRRIPSQVMQMLTSWLQEASPVGLVTRILNAFGCSIEPLPCYVLNVITSCLEDPDWIIRCDAVRALSSQSNLPEGVLGAIAARLDHHDSQVRKAAVEALSNQSHLPECVLSAIAARLDHHDSGIRWAAVEVLSSQSNLPEWVLSAAASYLDHHDSGIRWAAVEALSRQSNLPEWVLSAAASYLDHHDSIIRWAAVEALSRQSNLPERVLGAIAARLDHHDSNIRWAAVEALSRQSNLPERVLGAIAARLEDPDSIIRRATVRALSSQSNLPEGVLGAIAACLEDPDSIIRWDVVTALSGQSNLTEWVLGGIASRLDHHDSDIRRAAVKALSSQSNLPEGVLGAIAARLDHDDSNIRRTAVKALSSQSNLPDEVLGAVAARLDHYDSNIRRAAVRALSSQSNLPEWVLSAIAARLEDPDSIIRWAAVEALSRQSNLPEGVLGAIAARLDHHDSNIRWAAVEAMSDQSNLAEGVVGAEAARLDPHNSAIGWDMVKSFRGPSSLVEEIYICLSTLPSSMFIDSTMFSMLISQKDFYRVYLAAGNLRRLFAVLLNASFGHHLAWYIHDESCCLETQNRVQSTALHDKVALLNVIEQMQKDFGIPTVTK